ncbi:MAG: L-fuculose-phosphate aldolase [Desulfobacteraceae bacterium]|nr:L-fuculose-phosphate aldolase [Desulfobacteraceae bacterium]
MKLKNERKRLIVFGKKMVAANLTNGTGGNLSYYNRKRNLIAITPSGVEYEDMRLEDILVLRLDGGIVEGDRKPSSETGFHLALYEKRPDVAAVVHTHSVYATTFACLHREIPPVHYLVGFCGKKVPLAEYATYGSNELAKNIRDSIKDYNAVLLANHGLVSVGSDLMTAFNVALEVEFVARVYYQAQNIGKPNLLSDQQMEEVIEKFKDYGPVKND